MTEILQPMINPEEIANKRQRFLCPSCGKHTVLWLLPTTEVKDLPIKCKRCGKENIINIVLNEEILTEN